MNPRKARTRHLIQLGGLLQKSGLSETIRLEGDLQDDPSQADGVAVLVGGLLYLKSLLETPQTAAEARGRFLTRGAEFLKDDPHDAANGNEPDDTRSEEHVREETA